MCGQRASRLKFQARSHNVQHALYPRVATMLPAAIRSFCIGRWICLLQVFIYRTLSSHARATPDLLPAGADVCRERRSDDNVATEVVAERAEEAGTPRLEVDRVSEVE